MSLWGWIRRDGLLHAETCALVVVAIALIAPLWLAALVGVAAGVGKELWDKEHGGVANWHDVICDVFGVLLGVVLAML